MFKKIKFLTLLFIVITLNSCILGTVIVGTAVVASGTVYYINGYYIIEIPKTMRKVFNATIKTIQTSNSYSLQTQSYTNKEANITANLNAEKISITLTNINNKTTEIKIRVGIFGDEKKSTDLADKITKNIT